MSKEKNKDLNHKKFTFVYVPGSSFMHRLNPISKLVFLICLTILVFFTRSLILLTVISLLIILLALLSGISVRNLIRKMRFLIPILIISIILNIFFNATVNDEVLFYLFGLPFLPIRRLAVYYAFRAFFMVLILYTSALVFSYTTSPKDFVYSLMRLKIRYKYCFAFMVGMRYIPRIEEEAKTIALAQKARGFGLKKVNTIKKAYNLIFERLVSTLVSILRKGNTTSISMENRCFGVYKHRTNLIIVTYKTRDIISIIIIISIFVFMLLYLLQVIPIPQIPSLYSIFFG